MNALPARNAIVLVVDFLAANRLGPYGNTCYETHHFNRLAARSILFDQAITRSSDLGAAYQEIFQTEESDGIGLLSQLSRIQIPTWLMTDEPELEKMPGALSFDRVIPVVTHRSTELADTAGETELAGFFSQAMDAIADLEPGELGWIHSRGLGGAWDAPFELRNRLADSDDPAPPSFCLPPVGPFDPTLDDPDILLGYQQAGAAQVVLLDDFLGVVLDSLDTHPGLQSTLFCFVSPRGYPLGEHQWVGMPSQENPVDNPKARPYDASGLFNESIHVPMMVCIPHHASPTPAQGIRNGNLTELGWISGLLEDWFSGNDEVLRSRLKKACLTPADVRHEFVVSRFGEAQSIQTHAWKLIRTKAKTELYVKPDDLWEVNDVSQRCPQIVEQLCQVLDQHGDNGRNHGQIELSEELSIRLG